MVFLCVCTCVSASICISCASALALFLVCVFVIFQFLGVFVVLFYYSSFMPVYFPTRFRMGADPDTRRAGEKLGGIAEGETIIKIYCMKKINFQQKKKNKNNNTPAIL